MFVLWILGGIVGLLVLAFVVLHLLGKGVPEGHVISSTLHLARPPAEVFDVIADTAGIPSWDKGVNRVERVADVDGHETWRWIMGRNVMTLSTTRREPPTTLVRTIADQIQIFSGDWTYVVRPEGTGSAVELTEHGRIHVAIPRAMMHYLPKMADPYQYLRRHLAALAAHFGEAPRIDKGPRSVG
jgi:uncharacterized protein YndB with AHSA1/START domain